VAVVDCLIEGRIVPECLPDQGSLLDLEGNCWNHNKMGQRYIWEENWDPW
jgi:hypothetical protein